jgi:hypothetical protein
MDCKGLGGRLGTNNSAMRGPGFISSGRFDEWLTKSNPEAILKSDLLPCKASVGCATYEFASVETCLVGHDIANEYKHITDF